MLVLKVALPCPLRQPFDYLCPETDLEWQPGCRVLVPFGSRELVGVVIAVLKPSSEKDRPVLKPIIKRIDVYPSIPEELFNLILWISQYYHHPIGECFHTALPKALRSAETDNLQHALFWQLEDEDYQPGGGAKKQRAILELLKINENKLSHSAIIKQIPQSQATLKTLQKKNILSQIKQDDIPSNLKTDLLAPALNEEQQTAVDRVLETSGFMPFLLDGITGSGKTEVYLHITEQIIAEAKQALILVPEISLTPQFIARFQQRLNTAIVVLHSGLSNTARKQAWLLAREGLAGVVIGTRSAIFTPLKTPGLIIIDEEHDSAYKQQDGLRYHAKHIALIRAKRNHIPILLGSATPALESLHHVNKKQYQLLKLTQRAGQATPPTVKLVASQESTARNGLSSALYEAIKKHITAGNQALIFINRRGFAPVLVCHQCHWQAICDECDARLIVHKQKHSLQCHHCGHIQRLLTQCPDCKAEDLNTYGVGTEQIADSLKGLFPDTEILRIDRDTTQRINAFKDMVNTVNQGKPMILVGTQMLAKGHDFHNITLVGVLDADQGLYSIDFRATEIMAQLITQVTGRAGRGKKKGEVYIQTNQIDHPFWQSLQQQGYFDTAQAILKQREQDGMPPNGQICLIRAEAKHPSEAIALLSEIKDILSQYNQNNVMLMGPVPAVMERRGGRYRAQLLLLTPHKKNLHILLDQALPAISSLPAARKHRWSLDIDPVDLF